MKKAMTSLLPAAAALLAAGTAMAGSLPFAVKTASGVLVQVEGAVDFDKSISPAELRVTRFGVDTTGQPVAVVTAYADPSNVAYSKLAGVANANGYFQLGTSTKYANAKTAQSVTCASGLSQFTYTVGVRSASDSCGAFNAANSQAIP
ncbi:MAG TPA: hypothetical protein VN663_14300 [Ramlibacter sp.]|nr:hypothetical protein [Ramlibacter sp.]